MKREILTCAIAAISGFAALAVEMPAEGRITLMEADPIVEPMDSLAVDRIEVADLEETVDTDTIFHYTSPYFLPYSATYSDGNWKRLWLNTAVLCGAYVSALGVLELLPEDATAWNRADIQRVAPFNRWWRNVFKLGPEWDHDNGIFNYVLHPYAGAAYYMAARSCGFNFYQSFLYSAMISTFGWEFGIEAFMERPSYQDLFVTPVAGALIGECFYIVKRYIVQHDYRIAGSPVLGNIVAFLVDPVNEVIGLFAGNDCRHKRPKNPALEQACRHDIEPVSSHFWVTGNSVGIGVSCVF